MIQKNQKAVFNILGKFLLTVGLQHTLTVYLLTDTTMGPFLFILHIHL